MSLVSFFAFGEFDPWIIIGRTFTNSIPGSWRTKQEASFSRPSAKDKAFHL